MSPATTSAATDALTQRLRAAEAVLWNGIGDAADCDAGSLWDQVVRLVTTVKHRGDSSAAWLLTVALTGALPDEALVRRVSRALALREPEGASTWLLHATAPVAMQDGHADATLRIVTDRPLVDVEVTAKSEFLTGIQRVVRGVVSQWAAAHQIEPVVWTNRGGAYRALRDTERQRLLERDAREFRGVVEDLDEGLHEIVVPWQVPVVLIEVPSARASDRLAAVAALTGSSLRLVGHDCIPMSSAELLSLDEPEKFGRYLELVKCSDRVAGVSESAAAEFTGFTRALRAQGLSGPRVVVCPLPSVSPVAGGTTRRTPAQPVVVSVGSVGRRKNQANLIAAAELLWREGIDFELRVLGHVEAERSPVPDLVTDVQGRGRPLVMEAGVSDARIAETLAEARCLVMPTRHEGYGLPIVEALSHGVPVVTSDHGSMRELAEGCGGLVVDTEDVDALADAMRDVLVDDALHARLVAEAMARPVRTWQDYTSELWEALLT